MIGTIGAFALYAALGAGDYASSQQAMVRGGREVNPIVRGVGMPATKALVTVGLTLGDRSIKSRKGRWIYRGAVTVLYGVVIAHNSRVNRGGGGCVTMTGC